MSTTSATAPGAPSETRLTGKQRKAIVAGSIGNAVEWVDWAVYGTLAPIFASQFFAKGDPTAALLSTLAVFAVGFVMRPIGGALLGIYADRHGRKKGLTLTIGLMAGAAIVIAVCPTYEAIGVAAPLVLLLARLVQGFSAGGEFGSSSSFLVESAAPRRRAFAGSWQQVSVGAGALIASLMGFVLTSTLSEAAMQSWGWRVAFGVGGLLGLVGLWLRVTRRGDPELPRRPRGGPHEAAQPAGRHAGGAPAGGAARRRHHHRGHPASTTCGSATCPAYAHTATGIPLQRGAAWPTRSPSPYFLCLLPFVGAAVGPVRPQADAARVRRRVRRDRLPGLPADRAGRVLAAAGGRAGRGDVPRGLLRQLRGRDGRAVPGRGAQHRDRPAVRAGRRPLRRHRPVHHHLDEHERYGGCVWLYVAAAALVGVVVYSRCRRPRTGARLSAGTSW